MQTEKSTTKESTNVVAALVKCLVIVQAKATALKLTGTKADQQTVKQMEDAIYLGVEAFKKMDAINILQCLQNLRPYLKEEILNAYTDEKES